MKNDKPRNAMPCFKKSIQAVPSLLLISLIGWTYYTFIVEFCILELQKYPTRQIVYCTIGNIFFLLFSWCYLHVMFCNANYMIPNEFKLSNVEHNRLLYLTPPKQSEVLEQYVQNRHITLWLRTSDNLIRYCMKCHQIKPDRAHHCSACEKCVLKMDHHCPWTNNCVGFANQKSFMLMLIYGTLACLFYSTIVIEYYLHLGFVKPNIHTAFIVSGFASSMIFMVGMCAMLQEQTYNLLKTNQTLLESFQRRKQTVKFEDIRFTFDLGCAGNFLDCFGNNPFKWLIPINTSYGNGLVYRVRHRKNRGHLVFFSSSFLIIFMVVLFGQHIRLILKNETIIESLQDVHFINPRLTFNLGRMQNFLDITGEICWKWWIPINSSFGNGIYFEVRYNSGSSRGSTVSYNRNSRL